jgi:glycosyltransferase involved in cell wall biosynthesis
MKILYISYDGMTDPLGQSQVIPYITGLRKYNIEFVVLSAEKKDNYKKNKVIVSNLFFQSNIIWKPFKYTKKPNVLSTLWDIIKMTVLATKLQRKYNFHIVHCRSYIPSIIGLFLKNCFDVKFVFDMRGFYPDERVEGGLWNTRYLIYRLIYKYFKRKELQFLTKSDYIICLTSKSKKIIENMKYFEKTTPEIEVIPCCADLNVFSNDSISMTKINDLKIKLNICHNDFIISYLGSTGSWYMLEEMLDFFKRLLIKKVNAKFLFITHDNKNDILSKANYLDIPDSAIIVLPADRKDIPSVLSLSNCSIFFIKPVPSKQASSPTKMGEILGMGIPLICNSNVGDIDEIILNSGTGLVLERFTSEEYDRIIDKIDELASIPKERLLSVAEKFFSLQIGIEKYYSVYKKVMDKT